MDVRIRDNQCPLLTISHQFVQINKLSIVIQIGDTWFREFDICFFSELVVGLSDWFVVAPKAAVNELV